jgi:hypothetical protein
MVQVLMTGHQFQWNLSQNVGPRQPNRSDDVEMVRFGYICFKDAVGPTWDIPRKMQTELAALRPMGPFDEDLAVVIRAHQRHRGGTQDGVVSVQRSTSTQTYDGQHRWIIAILNQAMLDATDDFYPRIDRHPQSGPVVSAAVKEILIARSY